MARRIHALIFNVVERPCSVNSHIYMTCMRSLAVVAKPVHKAITRLLTVTDLMGKDVAARSNMSVAP